MLRSRVLFLTFLIAFARSPAAYAALPSPAMLAWLAGPAPQAEPAPADALRPVIRIVQQDPTAAPSCAGPADAPDASIRNYVYFQGRRGVAGVYAVPKYTGPSLRDGYGKGYGALAELYAREEESWRLRFDPNYRESTRALHHGQIEPETLSQRIAREDMTRRAERSLSQHEKAAGDGVAQLRCGDYQRAVISLTLAAKLNQSDPGCRVHLAQARLALGHYAEAAAVLRRALELQPQLIYRDLDLGSYYPNAADFANHVRRLDAAMKGTESSADLYLLAGYLHYQLGEFGAAHQALSEALRRNPSDAQAGELESITKP